MTGPKLGQKALYHLNKGREEAKRERKEAAEKKRKEDESWIDDVKERKSKQEEREEKRKADLVRKAEIARLLAEEEAAAAAAAEAATSKAATWKKFTRPTEPTFEEPEMIESSSATGIDNALDLLEVTAKMDKATIDRRLKTVYELYLHRELPNIQQERPGLRLQQYKDLLHKRFETSPDNPFRQATVVHNVTKEEKPQALKKWKSKNLNCFRES